MRDATPKRLIHARQRLLVFMLTLVGVLALLVLHALVPFAAPGLVTALTLAALLAAVLALRLAQRDYFEPFSEVRTWALRMRGGDLSARIPCRSGSEFAELAEDLNMLGEMLHSQARKVDQQLTEHTRHITQKSRSLAVLYDVAASINVARDLNELLVRFLHTLTDIVGAHAAAVRLADPAGEMRLVASVGLSDAAQRNDKTPPASDCECATVSSRRAVTVQRSMSTCESRAGCRFFKGDAGDFSMLVVPLQYRDQVLGAYNLYVSADQLQPMEDLEELFVSIGRHLGMAIEKSRMDNEAQLLSLVEERSHIANELHDSLAQTLVSIGFQVRILDELLHGGDEAATWQQMEHIERTLEDANREVRTLISHFRGSIDTHGLVPSIGQAVARFRAESGIPVFLQQEWPQGELPAQYEIQVLRIVQETLSNIRKHSQANIVRVMLSGDDSGNYRVLVEDDGVGMDAADVERSARDGTHEQHFGLQILHERAERLHANLQIESEPGEGTRVVLKFRYPPERDAANVNVDLRDTGYDIARIGN